MTLLYQDWAMAKKKTPPKAAKPRSFGGLIRSHSKQVQQIAQMLRALVFEELAEVDESFYGGRHPMAMYRTIADICWIQPLKSRCNFYLMQGPNLRVGAEWLEGKSDRQRHVKISSVDQLDDLPLAEWLRESERVSQASALTGISFDETIERMRAIVLSLPETKETMTWGKPHFRVKEKIFCGCGEDKGQPQLGLKAELHESKLLMKLPGIEKAPYSRKDDGWIAIKPTEFDDWDEIARLLVGSYRLIAPKRLVAQIENA